MPVSARHVRDGEAGFTLIELIVAMSIGMIVLFALFDLVDRALPATTRITNRVDAEQRTRPVVEHIEHALHSGVCLPNGTDANGNAVYLTPISSMSATQVTFYDFMPTPSQVSYASWLPEQRQFSFDAATGTLSESVWTVSGTSPPYTVTLQSTRQLLSNVRQNGATPFFAYQSYDPSTGALTSTTDPTKVAKVDVSFLAGPSTGNGTASAQDATVNASISLGLPTDFTTNASAANGPHCGLCSARSASGWPARAASR